MIASSSVLPSTHSPTTIETDAAKIRMRTRGLRNWLSSRGKAPVRLPGSKPLLDERSAAKELIHGQEWWVRPSPPTLSSARRRNREGVS